MNDTNKDSGAGEYKGNRGEKAASRSMSSSGRREVVTAAGFNYVEDRELRQRSSYGRPRLPGGERGICPIPRINCHINGSMAFVHTLPVDVLLTTVRERRPRGRRIYPLVGTVQETDFRCLNLVEPLDARPVS